MLVSPPGFDRAVPFISCQTILEKCEAPWPATNQGAGRERPICSPEPWGTVYTKLTKWTLCGRAAEDHPFQNLTLCCVGQVRRQQGVEEGAFPGVVMLQEVLKR